MTISEKLYFHFLNQQTLSNKKALEVLNCASDC